ncbi:unnamed protein product [Clonostachys byssicola]|uniref:Zn(2)-C6 fungal-type domain-containing protein n=1 Tax=Clonostachys byssicola TaxID=160290 RepID=A0A9N9UST9_9HYPO|nr:unnamed protein product [Clonostachys byssicola]
MPHVASQACIACRRLKRKCSRDIPSCVLCQRLGKDCEYPVSASDGNSAVRVHALHHKLLRGPDHPFPQAFFLDQDLHIPLRTMQLAQSVQPELKLHVAQYLSVDSPTLYNDYHVKVHTWLPMLSRKRLLNQGVESSERTDACHPLLLLCMELCKAECGGSPGDFHLYTAAKTLSSAVEQAGYLSLRLVQALVLITFYEVCHGLQPAAYLTVSRAARVGSLVGLYTSGYNSTLFQQVSTWTAGEEARRTWWAIFILDRYLLIDAPGLPFSQQDPTAQELLPVNDGDWEAGNTVASESLYTSSFSGNTVLGPFAMLCQASNILSKILQHKMSRKSASVPVEQLMEEAMHLHRTSSALQASIQASSEASAGDSCPFTSASAVCSVARLCLYNLYACNSTQNGRGISTPMQADLQCLSLQNISSLVHTEIPELARQRNASPFLAHCLYYAASEAAWIVREGCDAVTTAILKDLLDGLRSLESSYSVSSHLLSLLQQEGVLGLVDSERYTLPEFQDGDEEMSSTMSGES